MELKKNTYEIGLVVGTKRERDYWQNKIKEKIEEYRSKEHVSEMCALQELLKGE